MISAARALGISHTWTISDPSTPQNFTHYLAVSFIETKPDMFRDDTPAPTSGLIPILPPDLFYPLMIQSDSSLAIALAAPTALLIALLMITLY
jgi:hypothetical protein